MRDLCLNEWYIRKPDCGLPYRTVQEQERAAEQCERNACDPAALCFGSETHWMERAQAHHRSAALLRGEDIETVPLALVQTDLGISYAHVNCENAQETPYYTAPVCRCQYVHCYGFAAFDAGHLKSVKGSDYRKA